jgi:phosphonoacetaldehyde hydrolase
MKYTALFLDWAGTTVDHGSRAPIVAFQSVFRAAGLDVDETDARRAMGRDKWNHIRDTLLIDSVRAQFHALHGRDFEDRDIDEMYAGFAPAQLGVVEEAATPIRGVVEFVRAARAAGLRIGSSTGYPRAIMDAVEPIAARHGYAPDCCLTADDVPTGRPAPWMLLECARRLDIYPLPTIVVADDTPVGIRAARNAGMIAVGVAGTGNLLGLSESAFDALSTTDRAERLDAARRVMWEASAHVVVDRLPDLAAWLFASEN